MNSRRLFFKFILAWFCLFFSSKNSLSKNRNSPSESVWMLCSHRIHPPTKIIKVDDPEFCNSTSVVTTITPDYPVRKIRIAFSNWATITTGVDYPEIDGGSRLLIKASVTIDGVFFSYVSFDSKHSAVIDPGMNLWSDEIIVDDWIAKRVEIRTFCQMELNGYRPGSYRKNKKLSFHDGVFYSTNQSEHENILRGARFRSSSVEKYSYYYGPSLMISNGWDGRPVVLCLGDSIAYGDDFACSWLTEGIDSRDNGRFPYANLSVQGIRPSGQSSVRHGEFKRKAELINSAARVTNSNNNVFTCIVSQLGVNDAGGVNGDSLFKKMKIFWFFLKELWPDCKLIQTTFSPRCSKDLVHFYTTKESQKKITTTPLGSDRWYVSDAIKTMPQPIEAYIDLRSVWTGEDDGIYWREIGYNGILIEDLLPGDSSCQLDKPPIVGASIVFSVGMSNNRAEYIYGEVLSIHGRGPCTVFFSGLIKKYHAKGSLVAQTMTRDGIHPDGSYPSLLASLEVIKAKKIGVFHK